MAGTQPERTSVGHSDWLSIMDSVRRRLGVLSAVRKPASVGFFAEPMENRVLMSNSQPEFFAVDPAAVNEAQSIEQIVVDDWATFNPGSEQEVEEGQAVSQYIVTDVSNPELFIEQPTVTQDGTLQFTPTVGAFGVSTFTVQVQDDGGTTDGGTEAGGVDISSPQTFTITINPVNNAPSFSAGPIPVIMQGSPAVSITGWATFDPGSPFEADQTPTYEIADITNEALFLTSPSVNVDGTLSYSIAADAFGESAFKLRVVDDGGLLAGGINASDWQTFNIVVEAKETPAEPEPEPFNYVPPTIIYVPGPAFDFSNIVTKLRAMIDRLVDRIRLQLQILSGNPNLSPGQVQFNPLGIFLPPRPRVQPDDTSTGESIEGQPQIGSIFPNAQWYEMGDTVGLTVTGVTDPQDAITGVWFYRDANGNKTIDDSDQLLGTGQDLTGGKWRVEVPSVGHFELGQNVVLAVAQAERETADDPSAASKVVSRSINFYRQLEADPGKNFVEYFDANANKVRLTLTGGGSITPLFDTDDKNADPVRVIVSGASAATSVLNVNVTRSKSSTTNTTTIGELEIDGGLLRLSGAKLNLDGSLTSTDSIKNLTLNDVDGGADQAIEIGGSIADKINMTFGQLVDVSISTHGSINNFKAVSWVDTDDLNDVLETGFVNIMRINGRPARGTSPAVEGNLDANIMMTSRNARPGGIGLIQVAGDTTGSWELGYQKLNNVRISGAASGTWQAVGGGFAGINIQGKAENLNIMSGADIASFRAGQAKALSIIATGEIGSINVVDWDKGQLIANKVNSLNVAGRAGSRLTAEVPGDITEVEIMLAGEALKAGQQTLGSMKVSGKAQGMEHVIPWQITGNVGSISLGAAHDIDMYITATKTSPGNLGKLSVAGGLDFSHIHLDGSVKTVSVRSTDSLLLEAGESVGSFISRGEVANTRLIALGNINSVVTGSWHKGEIVADKINQIVTRGVARSAGSPAVAGDFLADVTITGQGVTTKANALGAATITGLLHDSVWRIAGNAGRVAVGAINNSTLYVGVNADVPAGGVIDSAAAFLNPSAVLSSFVVTGRAVTGGTTASFTSSRIAAGVLRDVRLRYIDTNIELPNGFTAASRIGSYIRKVGPAVRDVITVRNQTAAGVYDPLLGTPPTGGYKLQIVG